MRRTIEDGLRWKKMYEEQHMTFEEIALEDSTSTCTVRRWFALAGGQARPPAHDGRGQKRKLNDGVKPPRSKAVNHIPAPRGITLGNASVRNGKRRRGRKI